MRTSLSIVVPLAFGVALCSATISGATPLPDQQRPAATPAANSGAAPTATSKTAAGGTIEETSFKLKRADVDAKLKTLPKAPASDASKKKSGLSGLTDSLKKSVNGDERREDAAKLVVEDLAQQASANNSKTVVVVIGSEDDRDKVKASMDSVHRPVVLALLDRSVKDDTYDNSAISSGLSNQITGTATNVWVFIPRSGQKAHKPDQTLSSRVATDKVWTTIFAADGDLPPEASNAIPKPGSTSSTDNDTRGTSGSAPAVATATTPAPAPAPTFAVGDVVRPKIASVKLMAQPSDSAKSLATLAKTDELVVIGGDKDGFTSVQGSAAAGWVKTVMVAKQ
jgi:hypothetical protein